MAFSIELKNLELVRIYVFEFLNNGRYNYKRVFLVYEL